MATVAQITANQANAQHSTGPKTAEGKARVAQNAIRHGLTATNYVVRDDEREEFNKFSTQLYNEVKPIGVVENLTFNELLHAAWNLHRARRMEEECSAHDHRDFTDSQRFSWLDRIARYQARTQRAYYRALAELRTLQTNRALRETELSEEVAQTIPVLIAVKALTKQTQSATSKLAPRPPITPAAPGLNLDEAQNCMANTN